MVRHQARWAAWCIAAALAGILTDACHAAAPQEATFASNDSTTVITAEALASAPLLEATRALVLGGDDPREAYSFYSVSLGGIAVDSAANVDVLESRDAEVRVFDAQGQLLRRIGHRGDGPGELRSPRQITISGDTLFILDNTQQLFDLDGTFLQRIQLHLNAPPRATGTLARFPGGRGAVHMERTAAGLALEERMPGESDAGEDQVGYFVQILNPATGDVGEAVFGAGLTFFSWGTNAGFRRRVVRRLSGDCGEPHAHLQFRDGQRRH